MSSYINNFSKVFLKNNFHCWTIITIFQDTSSKGFEASTTDLIGIGVGAHIAGIAGAGFSGIGSIFGRTEA